MKWVETNQSNFAIYLQTIIFFASCYYTEGIDTNVKYGCSQMLDGLVSSHPQRWATFSTQDIGI